MVACTIFSGAPNIVATWDSLSANATPPEPTIASKAAEMRRAAPVSNIRSFTVTLSIDGLKKECVHSMRDTSPNCLLRPLRHQVAERESAQRRLGLDENRWSAGSTRSQELRQDYRIKAEQHVAGHGEQMRHVNRGHDMDPGRRTHPGADAGPVRARAVMRRMLEFVRDCAAGRHSQ